MLAARKGHSPDVLVEGKWAHRILIDRGASINTFLWCPEAAAGGAPMGGPPGVRGGGVPAGGEYEQAAALAQEVAGLADSSYEISPAVLRRVSSRNAPDGLISLVMLPDWDPATVRISAGGLVLVIDGVNYAGNLGNLIRTADAAGAEAVLVTNGGVKRTHPLVFVSSRAAVLSLPILDFDTIEEAVSWLDERDFVRYLADPDADLSYAAPGYAGEAVAVVVGSEGKGLSPQWQRASHRAVSIPLHGLVDSLNVGTAAAVLLFEVARQHGSTAPSPRPRE